MDRIEPLIPGVRNPLDIALGWISRNERKWQKKLARESAERAAVESVAQYVATEALGMLHAPLEQREEACRLILATLRDEGLWPPAPDELTEPTA